jgi:hypothetical protein
MSDLAAMTIEGSPIQADIRAEALRLLAEVDRLDLQARLIGGMAIRLLAGDRMPAVFERPIQDLDFIVGKRAARGLSSMLVEAGYLADEQFNALNGARRMLFIDPAHGRQIDVFVESFEMCHSLPLSSRIDVRAGTLPAADVLMTKLQIVELNAKDRGDLYALLASHDVRAGDEDAIAVDRIASLTSGDWGLQHTFELNLERLRSGLPEVPAQVRDAVAGRIDALARAMEAAPKSRKWKVRAKVGERKRWYEEPEEVDREG